MSDNPQVTEAVEEEFDELLPAGWTGAEGQDIFDPSTWDPEDGAADAQVDEETGDEGNSTESGDTDGGTNADEAAQDTSETASEGPTTADAESGSGKLSFDAQVDHVLQHVELDPAALPELYQKAQALDRYQAKTKELTDELVQWDKLAAQLNYESRQKMLEGILENQVQDYLAEHPGIPEDLARDYLTRQFSMVTPKAASETPVGQDTKPAGRDFKAEVAELFRTYPEARRAQIPQEVVNAAASSDKPLVQAYAEFQARTAAAQARKAEKENKILRQNQAAARRAPVSKVTGGGKTDTSPEDDFLKGFNEDAWT